MKIAVSSMGKDLDSMVDSRFGRCMYFIIVETEEGEIKGHETVENTGAQSMRGAGITAAQLIANKGAQTVISGNIGPNAFNVLSQTGIKIYTGVFGISVRDAVKKYLNGELKEATSATGPRGPQFGSQKAGFGRGAGRGMGGGRGGPQM